MLKVAVLVVMHVYAPCAGSPDGPGATTNPTVTVETALETWSAFTASADTTLLAVAFDPGGPQWAELADDRPIDAPPLTMTPFECMVRSESVSTATVWALVRVARAGYRSEEFSWDFDLIATDGGWRVWAVVPAERPSGLARVTPVPRSTTTVTALTTSPSPTVTSSTTVAAVAASSPSGVDRGTRLPALSAWIIVLTLAGVAGAGYLAPRLEGRRER